MSNNLITKGEKILKQIFLKDYNLTLEKITTNNNKSADFYILKDNKTIAVCEVKDIESIESSEKNGWSHNKETDTWSRPDNAPNRIRTKIHNAFNQLSKYELPKIIVFVNFDSMVDIKDLQQAINGFLPYYSKDDPTKITHIYDGAKKTLERIKYEVDKIDLYIWLGQNSQDKKIYFRTVKNNKTGQELMINYFNSTNLN